MRCVTRWLLASLIGVAVTGFQGSVRAQDSHPGPDRTTTERTDGATGADHARRGRRARDAGRWVEAQAAYKAAFEATDPASGTEKGRAENAGELGLCELALHKYRDAAEHLAWSLEHRGALRLPLQLRFEEGQRRAAPYVATLYLSVNPPDAQVLLDGKAIDRPTRTYRLFLEPGQHMVKALSTGYESAFQSFDIVAGKMAAISMQLPRVAAPAASAKEDEKKKESARATLDAAGAPAPGRLLTPNPWASWQGALRISGIALTTATLSVGAMFMVRASALDGDLTERREGLIAEINAKPWTCTLVPPPAGCAELHRLRDDRNRFAIAGTATVVAGTVLGGLTAASFFTDLSFLGGKPAPARERPQVSWMVTPQQVGVRGEW